MKNEIEIYNNLIEVTEKSLNAMKLLKASPAAQIQLVNFLTELGKKVLIKTNEKLIEEFSQKAQKILSKNENYFSNEARESLANFFDLLKSNELKNEAGK